MKERLSPTVSDRSSPKICFDGGCCLSSPGFYISLYSALLYRAPYLLVHVCDGRGQLQPVQQVVAVVVVHLEVVQLQLLRRHVRLWLVNHPLQVLHDVTGQRWKGGDREGGVKGQTQLRLTFLLRLICSTL